MFRLRTGVCVGAGLSAVQGLRSIARAEETRSDMPEASTKPTLAIYLNAESKATIKAQLPKMGIVDADWRPPERIVLKSRMDEVDHYVYSPIYGERVAFRLQGVVKCKEGIVGLGRLSNMQGEMYEENFETSIVLGLDKSLPKSAISASQQALADLPTLLFKNVASVGAATDKWTGTVPAGEVLGVSYASREGVTLERFVPDVQLVIDGHICSSKYLAEDGCSCAFEKSDVPDTVPDSALKKRVKDQPAGKREKRQDREEKKEGEEDEETCPVCRFMKAGPCGDAFRAWDDCVQGLKDGEDLKKCFPMTMDMMTCMQKHEYYDIMTANSQAKMAHIDAADEAGAKKATE
jgi:intermembrane space import and assembly protein 40